MITIGDIVALAKSGYKPADVKEIIALSKEETKTETPKENMSPLPTDSVAVAPTEPVEGEKKESETEPEPDYKALYEKTQIELKEAQKANRTINISTGDDDTKPDKDILTDLFKEFM